jgi:tetratricopeptide (TPR) repeat protein
VGFCSSSKPPAGGGIWLRCALILLPLTALVAPLAAAEVTLDLTPAQALELAGAALEQGQLDTASKLLELVRRAEPDNRQLLFLDGMLALAQGRLDDGIAALRALLNRDPTLLRVRLELARALFLRRDFDAARYNFELALGAPELTEAARANVRAFLRQIEVQTSSLSLTVSVVTDSNPTQQTRAENIVLLGQLFRLNPDARARSAVGLGLTLDGRLALDNERQTFLHGQLQARDFPNDYADFAFGNVNLGHTFIGETQWLSVEAGPHTALYRGRQLYDGWLSQATHFAPFAQRWALRQTLSGMTLRYTDFDHLNGWQVWLEEELRYALSARAWAAAAVSAGHRKADDPTTTYDGLEARASYLTEPGQGFIVEGRLTVGRLDFDAASFLFGEARHDTYRRVELRLTSRRLAVAGFAPQAQLGYWHNDSNLVLFAFERWYAEIGVTRDF